MKSWEKRAKVGMLGNERPRRSGGYSGARCSERGPTPPQLRRSLLKLVGGKFRCVLGRYDRVRRLFEVVAVTDQFGFRKGLAEERDRDGQSVFGHTCGHDEIRKAGLVGETRSRVGRARGRRGCWRNDQGGRARGSGVENRVKLVLHKKRNDSGFHGDK